jgi:hypothetical protein
VSSSPPWPGRKDRPLVRGLLAGALLLGMAALLVLSSLHKKLSYDEYDNLAYGHQVLSRGPTPPPNGQRMPILALNALACRAEGCREREVNATEAGRLLVRLPTMLFALLLGAAVFGWASEMFGGAAGLLALALYVFNPSFLAHGKQVTSDVAAAFFVVPCLWTAWRLARGRGPAGPNLLACALALTGALLSKYTSLLILPVLGVLLAWTLVTRRRRRERLAPPLVAAALFTVFLLFFLNAAYLFRGTFARSDHYAWKSERLQPLGWLALPLPLPRVFVLGLDFSYYVQEHPDVGRGNNYVLGRLSTEGTAYAFPFMILLKTPLAFFPLLLLAARSPGSGESPPDAAFLLLPFALITAFFSLLVAPQLGIRYLLPALVCLIVYAGRAAGTGSPRAASLLLVLTAWHAGSTLSYHPHYMSYFNELIGSRVNAYRFLADSNLDWEDRSWDIARYQERHPEVRLVIEPPQPQPGLLLVGANKLVGVYEPERYRWLRENFTPVGHIGYSYLLFRVTPERLREVLAGEGPPR